VYEEDGGTVRRSPLAGVESDTAAASYVIFADRVDRHRLRGIER
jgi:hypothetical protein